VQQSGLLNTSGSARAPSPVLEHRVPVEGRRPQLVETEASTAPSWSAPSAWSARDTARWLRVSSNAAAPQLDRPATCPTRCRWRSPRAPAVVPGTRRPPDVTRAGGTPSSRSAAIARGLRPLAVPLLAAGGSWATWVSGDSRGHAGQHPVQQTPGSGPAKRRTTRPRRSAPATRPRRLGPGRRGPDGVARTTRAPDGVAPDGVTRTA